MTGLGGLINLEHGVGIGLIQLQFPVIVINADLAAQTEVIVHLFARPTRSYGETFKLAGE